MSNPREGEPSARQRDAAEIAENEVVRKVVCIIGGGPVGIAMARELIDRPGAPGVDVLVLESGIRTDFKIPNSVRQSLYKGTPVGLMTDVNPEFLTNSRLRMYGGTTNHWGFWARTLDDIDLGPRPGYRPLGWPIDRAVLDPVYERANRLGGYDELRYDDVDYWTARTGTQALEGRLGAPLATVVFHAQYDDGMNKFQVQFGDELDDAENVEILFNCNVLKIHTDAARSRVTHLECAALIDGKKGPVFYVEADQFVLATGGLEATRLLLLSGNLGDNARGDLGGHFMVHPLIRAAALAEFAVPFDDRIEQLYAGRWVPGKPLPRAGEDAERFRAAVYDERFEGPEEAGFTVFAALAPTAHVLDEKKIGNFRICLGFRGREVQVNVNWEQVAQRESRITLHPTAVDPVLGQPLLQLDWRLAQIDKTTVIEALSLCEQFFAGVKDNRLLRFDRTTDLGGGPDHWTFDPTGLDDHALWPGDHPMGTARMSALPEDGIVDRDLKVHTLDNLYLPSTAAFPAGGYANPTLTLLALSLRLADHLRGKLGAGIGE
jgi:choline dehydrogenase-like flavoprotein